MARSIRSPLEDRSNRLKLPMAKKPMFARIGPGLGLGYRRNKTAGTWVVRVADGDGRNWTKAIGLADDFDEADGNSVLSYWQAQDQARALARKDKGVDADADKPATVAEALDGYEADLRNRQGDVANVARVRRHLTPGLRSKTVALLTSRELKRWRDSLIKTDAAPATVNRITRILKAALNHCADHDERITSRRAWQVGLAAIGDAEESRNVILNEPEVRRIIAEAQTQNAALGLLVEVAAVTGARYGQLARLEVQDLQADRPDPRLMVPPSRKGKSSKKKTRNAVPIPARLAAKLTNVAKGRAPNALLLAKASGSPWRKSNHGQPFARAVKAAGLDPDEVTLYALRHSSIVRQIIASVPIRVVAVNHDTSVTMIERTYSRHIGDHADALARVALLDISEPIAGNVVPMRAAIVKP